MLAPPPSSSRRLEYFAGSILGALLHNPTTGPRGATGGGSMFLKDMRKYAGVAEAMLALVEEVIEVIPMKDKDRDTANEAMRLVSGLAAMLFGEPE